MQAHQTFLEFNNKVVIVGKFITVPFVLRFSDFRYTVQLALHFFEMRAESETFESVALDSS